MELLMTPEEAVRAAFGSTDAVAAGLVTESLLLAAQRRYLRPVLGGAFCDALAAGKYDTFLDSCVKPVLALFVKYLVLPDAAVRTGRLGIVKFGGDSFEPADDATLARLRRRVRADAETLLAAAVELLEAAPAEYPEYDCRGNVKHRVSVDGGIVL